MSKQELRVREYKNAQEFEHEARKMTKDGWEIKEQSAGSTHMNVGRTFFTTVFTGGLNLLTPKVGGASYTKGKIIVTWIKGAPKKRCPRCSEDVLRDAMVCRYCQHDFQPAPAKGGAGRVP